MLSVGVAGASAKAAGLWDELAWVPLRWVESAVASVGAIDRGSVPLILAAVAPSVAYCRLDRSESGCHEHLFVEETTGSAARVVLSTAPGGEVATAVAQVGPARLWDQLRQWCTEYVRADGFLPSSWLDSAATAGRWQQAADVVAAALDIHDPDVRYRVSADEAAGQLVIAWSEGPCAEYVHWLARQVRPWPEVVYRYERTRTPRTPKVAA